MRWSRQVVFALVLASCKDASEARPSGARPSGTQASANDAAPSDAGALRVFDPGREPRARGAFLFVPGRTGEHSLTLVSRLDRGAVNLGEERLSLRLGVRYPTADTVELTLLHAETSSPDIRRIESTRGARSIQKFHPSGEAELPEITLPAAVDARAGDYIQGALVQIASNLLPALPHESIGEGARWGGDDLRYELIARRGPLLVVERRSGKNGPTQLVTGETVFVKEEQTYRIDAPLDGIATRVEAVLVADQPGGTVMTTRLHFDAEGPR